MNISKTLFDKYTLREYAECHEYKALQLKLMTHNMDNVDSLL